MIRLQIIPLYEACLAILAKFPPSLEILCTFEELICSGFDRATDEELGPIAFVSFWDATYSRCREIQTACPAGLRTLLKSLNDSWGIHASGLEHDTESQTDHVSCYS